MSKSPLIVVLGSPNTDEGELLAIAHSRLNKAIEVFPSHPNATILLTGGFGEYFNRTNQPHALLAYKYLLQNGIKSNAICTEFALSSNTIEDAECSIPIVQHLNANPILLVTSDFHMPRAQFPFEANFPNYQVLPVIATTPKSISTKDLSLHESSQLKELKANYRPLGNKKACF